jgi:signal transduction histidine kinase/ligand-binding sensor domain-containing protein
MTRKVSFARREPRNAGKYTSTMRSAQGKGCVWLLMLLVFSTCAFALDPALDISQYAHTAWRVRDGFGKGPIHSIAQTPDGYLWLGTEFGLLRFDGVRALPWQPPAGEHLPSDVVTRLLVSRDGTLWIGTGKGLASWKDGKLTHYPEMAGWILNALVEDHQGTVWAGGFGVPRHGKLCAIKDGRAQCSDPGEGVQCIYEDRKNTLWVSTFQGLWRWKPDPEFFPTGMTMMSSLVEDQNGGLLFGRADGIHRFINGKPQANSVEVLAPLRGVNSLLWDHDGNLWVGTFGGLAHAHRGRTDFFKQVDGLSANVVNSVFEDREGNIWVATEGGLDRFRDFAVATFSSKEGFPAGLYGSILAAKDGSLWFSSSDALARWKNSKISMYGRLGRANHLGTQTALRDMHDRGLFGQVRGLFQDSQGRIWITMPGGFGYMNNEKFVLTKAVPGETRGSIAQGAAGDLWFSFDKALFHLMDDSTVEQISWERLGIKDADGLIAVDPLQGGLWIGFPQGGVAYLRHNQIERSYTTADGLGEGRITHLRVDRGGALWASAEGGLSRIKDGHIATLSAKNGLPCNAVHWSEEDADHSVWLYLECGLVRIAPSAMSAWIADPIRPVRATLMDSTDGVAVKSVIFGGFSSPVTKSLDGKLWFSVENGLSVVDPRHLPFNILPPPVHIERIFADGKTYWQNWSGDPSSAHPRLPPLLRDLTIDFTALSLVEPEKIHFRFKLDGQDKDWREVVNDRRVEYSNLSPGNYRFRVIACNNSGVWNEQGASLDFTIPPAYYQTSWFRALCLLTILAMLRTVYRLRVRTLERRQATLEKHQSEIRALNDQMIKAQEAERMRIAGELHDGVLQQITSLTLRLAKVRRQVPPDSEAVDTVNGLQQQLIQIGTDIRHLSHELHPALLQDAGLPATLCAYCEEFSKVRGIRVSCETDETVKDLSPGSALCLYRIAQEALGNAAKHSEATTVEVRLAGTAGRVCLSVSDNGKGCDRSKIGNSGGLGLISMRERVLQLEGTFAFDSEPGRGTTVKVEIPFRQGT